MPVPAEEVLAAACFACDQIITLDARIRIADTSCAREAQNLRETSKTPADLRLITAIALVLLMPTGSSPPIWGPWRLVHCNCFAIWSSACFPSPLHSGSQITRATRGKANEKETPQKSEVKGYEVKRK